jgi:hypothetical protein
VAAAAPTTWAIVCAVSATSIAADADDATEAPADAPEVAALAPAPAPAATLAPAVAAPTADTAPTPIIKALPAIFSPRARASISDLAMIYQNSIVYFFDDASYAEPEAFWVGGARESTVVVQPDAPQRPVTCLLRNGASPNTVTIESGNWKDSLTLAPGEERRIEIPMDQTRGASKVRFVTSAGFRPSEVDPNSRDDRFLGVWVKVE